MENNEEKVEPKFESYKLSEETRANISHIIGMDLDEFNKMNDDEQQKYIEKKNGRPIGYDCRVRVDGIPVSGMTADEAVLRTEKLINKSRKNMSKKYREK